MVGNRKTIADYIREYENDPEFVAEGLALKITEEALAYMETKGLSQSWLAERMGVSRAHVSRIFNAAPNMTLLTFAKIAVALGLEADASLNPKPAKTGASEYRRGRRSDSDLVLVKDAAKAGYSTAKQLSPSRPSRRKRTDHSKL